MTMIVRRRRTMVWESTSPSTSRPSPSSATSASSPTSPQRPTSASSPTSSTPSTPASSSSPSSPPRSVVSAGADPQLANIFADLRGGPVAPGAQSLRQVWRLDQERYSVLQFPGKKEAEKILLEETNFICSRTVTWPMLTLPDFHPENTRASGDHVPPSPHTYCFVIWTHSCIYSSHLKHIQPSYSKPITTTVHYGKWRHRKEKMKITLELATLISTMWNNPLVLKLIFMLICVMINAR